MYELERARGDLLERRAQFYLTLLTFLLGALSLKADLWGKVRLFLWTLWRSHPVWVGSIFVEGVLCSSSAAASFLFILLVFKPRSREKPYPPALLDRLFDPEYDSGDEAEAKLVRNNAKRYAWATEDNNQVNVKISKWLVRASAATLTALLSLGLLIVTIFSAYLQF